MDNQYCASSEEEWIDPLLHRLYDMNKACRKNEFSLLTIDMLVDTTTGHSGFPLFSMTISRLK